MAFGIVRVTMRARSSATIASTVDAMVERSPAALARTKETRRSLRAIAVLALKWKTLPEQL
jgi:hypothetical protein